MVSGIPSYRPDDVNYMDKLLINQGYTGFKCVYYYASTAIAFNEAEDKIFIKGTVRNEQQRNKNKVNISSNSEGVYRPSELLSVMIRVEGQSYTVTGVRPLLSGGTHDLLKNITSKREAKYNQVVESGIFIETDDGKIYQILFRDGEMMNQIARMIDKFRNGHLFSRQTTGNLDTETTIR